MQTGQKCVNILISSTFEPNHASIKLVQACCKLNSFLKVVEIRQSMFQIEFKNETEKMKFVLVVKFSKIP